MEQQDEENDDYNNVEEDLQKSSTEEEDDEEQHTSVEYKLNPPPSACISSLSFSPVDDLLLVCSWDNYVRVYNTKNGLIQTQYMHDGPVLDCCFSDSNLACFSGGLDKNVKMFDVRSGTEMILGEHVMPVRNISFNLSNRMVVSGSWDATIKIWDTRTFKATGTYEQPGKVYALDTTGNRMIVGTSGRHVWTWDIRQMKEPEQKKENILKYQIRCIRAFVEGDGYALSSTEGRVSMNYFDQSPEIQEKKICV